MTLYVLCGVSGSGKSTYGIWLAKEKGACVVATDDIREELFGNASVQDNPKLVFDTAYARVRGLLESGKDVVFDATNLDKYRRAIIKYCSDLNSVRYELHIIPATYEQCVYRQSLRGRKVPVDVVYRQWEKFNRNDFKAESKLGKWDKIIAVEKTDDGYKVITDYSEEI